MAAVLTAMPTYIRAQPQALTEKGKGYTCRSDQRLQVYWDSRWAGQPFLILWASALPLCILGPSNSSAHPGALEGEGERGGGGGGGGVTYRF